MLGTNSGIAHEITNRLKRQATDCLILLRVYITARFCLNMQQLKRTLILIFPNTRSREFPVKIFYNELENTDDKISQKMVS